MDNITDKIKYCRFRMNWTQEQLARKIGVSLNTVQRWESGSTYPSPLARERLHEILEPGIKAALAEGLSKEDVSKVISKILKA